MKLYQTCDPEWSNNTSEPQFLASKMGIIPTLKELGKFRYQVQANTYQVLSQCKFLPTLQVCQSDGVLSKMGRRAVGQCGSVGWGVDPYTEM